MPEILEAPTTQIPDVKGMSTQFRKFLLSSPESLAEFIGLHPERQKEIAGDFPKFAGLLDNDLKAFRELVDVNPSANAAPKAKGVHG